MYAVIKTGAHQYRVSQGDVIDVDKLPGAEGDKISFDQVMMIGGKKVSLGAPLVKGAKVEATIKQQFREDKILVFKYKRRKNYKKLQGHRQPLTKVEIGKITGG